MATRQAPQAEQCKLFEYQGYDRTCAGSAGHLRSTV